MRISDRLANNCVNIALAVTGGSRCDLFNVRTAVLVTCKEHVPFFHLDVVLTDPVATFSLAPSSNHTSRCPTILRALAERLKVINYMAIFGNRTSLSRSAVIVS